jgi:hypothetical protein
MNGDRDPFYRTKSSIIFRPIICMYALITIVRMPSIRRSTETLMFIDLSNDFTPLT